jgi:hypothetical protein
MNTEERILWVAYTNTDLTEGRGRDVPHAVCERESTAKRLAKNCYVMGAEGPVRPIKLLHHEGRWYAPYELTTPIPPTKDDLAREELKAAVDGVLEKARAAGLTDAEIKLLKKSL